MPFRQLGHRDMPAELEGSPVKPTLEFNRRRLAAKRREKYQRWEDDDNVVHPWSRGDGEDSSRLASRPPPFFNKIGPKAGESSNLRNVTTNPYAEVDAAVDGWLDNSDNEVTSKMLNPHAESQARIDEWLNEDDDHNNNGGTKAIISNKQQPLPSPIPYVSPRQSRSSYYGKPPSNLPPQRSSSISSRCSSRTDPDLVALKHILSTYDEEDTASHASWEAKDENAFTTRKLDSSDIELGMPPSYFFGKSPSDLLPQRSSSIFSYCSSRTDPDLVDLKRYISTYDDDEEDTASHASWEANDETHFATRSLNVEDSPRQSLSQSAPIRSSPPSSSSQAGVAAVNPPAATIQNCPTSIQVTQDEEPKPHGWHLRQRMPYSQRAKSKLKPFSRGFSFASGSSSTEEAEEGERMLLTGKLPTVAARSAAAAAAAAAAEGSDETMD